MVSVRFVVEGAVVIGGGQCVRFVVEGAVVIGGGQCAAGDNI